MLKKNKIVFTKYKTRGSDYHYQEIDKYKLYKFNTFVLARYQIQIELMLKCLNNLNKKLKHLKILDIGCGDGVLLHLFKKRLRGNKYLFYGIDSSKEALRIAKEKNPWGDFKNCSATKIKFNDNTFDLIVSSDVIEHLNKNDGIKMVKEIKRVCRPNGFFIIGTPIKITRKPKDKFHIKEYSPNELLQLANTYFSSVKIIKSHPLIFYYFYIKPINFFGKKIYLFYLLINLLAGFFKINLFKLKAGLNNKIKFTYMFLSGKNGPKDDPRFL